MSSRAKKKKQDEQAPNPKRANAPLRCDYTSGFEKDWQRLGKSGRANLQRAKDGMMRLVANDGALPPEFSDHPLRGQYAGYREFHAGGDLLVIYHQTAGAIVFTRMGSHAELFE